MSISTRDEVIQPRYNIAHPDEAILRRCIEKKLRQRGQNLEPVIEPAQISRENKSGAPAETMYRFIGLVLPARHTGQREVRRVAQSIGDSILSAGGFVIMNGYGWTVDWPTDRREKSKWQ